MESDGKIDSRNGKVWLVGAGPGDPELITVKGLRLLRTCDAVVYDALVGAELLAETKPGCLRLHVGKRGGTPSATQSAINRLLVELAREGRQVVRLKGGDPLIFGRAGEEMSSLAAAGIPFAIVPGITAALGAAAAAAMPLTHRDFSAGVVFATGQEASGSGTNRVPWAALARSGMTLCLYMGVGNCARIIRDLMIGGMPGGIPVAAVEWATSPRERRLHSTLEALPRDLLRHGMGSPCLVVVGQAAKYPQQLAELVRAAADHAA